MSKASSVIFSDSDDSSDDEGVQATASSVQGGGGGGGAEGSASKELNMVDEDEDEDDGDSEEEEEEDDDDDDDHVRPSRRKRQRDGSGSSKQQRKKKKKKNAAARFFEDAAEEDDDDGFEDKYAEDDESEEQRRRREDAERQIDRRREREANVLQNARAEDIAASIKMRARNDRMQQKHYKRLRNESMIKHRGIHLPADTDPKMFAVKCKPSMEQQLVCQILNKALHFMRDPRKQNLPIMSASKTRTKGYIYIEARNMQHVVTAVRGMSGIYPSKITKIPVRERTTTLNIASASQDVVKPGRWVRCKRSAFKGDIAKIVEVSHEDKRAIVQLMPRLDLVTLEPIYNFATGKRIKQKKLSKLFFNPEEVRTYVASASRDMRLKNPERRLFERMRKSPMLTFWQGGYYTSTGWRLMRFDLKALDVNAVPTLEEKKDFESNKLGLIVEEYEEYGDGMDESGINSLSSNSSMSNAAGGVIGNAAQKNLESKFLLGDNVRVVKTELKGLRGVIKSVDTKAKECVIKPTNLSGAAAEEEYDIDMDILVKEFSIGAHVKVTSGYYYGETGTVIKVEFKGDEGAKDEAILMLDNSTSGDDGMEIKVFTESLRETKEVAQRLTSLEGYKMYDLVATKDQLRGCIVKIGREKLTVLLQGGAVETCVPADLMFGHRNQESKRSVALDAQKQAVTVNDSIEVKEGEFKGYRGSVKHVSRNFLFVKCAQQMDLAGIICITSNQCTLQGVRSNRDLSKLSMGAINSSGPSLAMRNTNRGRRGRVDVKHPLHKATVRVTRGQWKGHVGMVKRHTDTHVEVEIHARHKTIQLEMECVKKVGNSEGRISSLGQPRFGGSFGAPSSGVGTFGQVVATPGANDYDPNQAGGATPLDGGVTPGGAWDADAFATPAGGNDAWGEPGDTSSIFGLGSNASGAPSSVMPPPSSNASRAPSSMPQSSGGAWGHGQGATPAGPDSSYIGDAGGATPGELHGEMPPPAQQGVSSGTLIDNWVRERACVIVRNKTHLGCVGMVTEIMAGRMCRVDILEPENKRGVIDVREAHLAPQLPSRADQVLIVGKSGDEDLWGRVGNLLNVQDNDAVVTFEDMGMHFFSLEELCKLMPL